MNILFVCSGNTCRSPMAEGILKKIIREADAKNIKVSSAGVVARNGDSASTNAIEVSKLSGIDLSKHSSRFVTLEIFKHSDLLLCMTKLHKHYLEENFDTDDYKIHTLIEYCNANSYSTDVLDPYGGSIIVYKRCFDQIHNLIITKLTKKLIWNF